uniref:Uncharacterized protein n=1 Tax=Ananas comosus var. bracteatus TaxID=296719 RepID=A0A6V7PLG5_ANACO|nr:unnamed protein product [Ananas comosus var. bracteatus]
MPGGQTDSKEAKLQELLLGKSDKCRKNKGGLLCAGAKTRFQGTTGLFIDLPLRSVVVIARLAIFSGFGGPRSADWNRRLEPLITACGCHVFEQTRLISPGAFFRAPGPAFQILNMDMNSVCQLSAPDCTRIHEIVFKSDLELS